MTTEETRRRITSLLQEGISLALEAEQISTTNWREARDLANLAFKRLKKGAQESESLQTEGERRVSGLISGQVAIHLRERFGIE